MTEATKRKTKSTVARQQAEELKSMIGSPGWKIFWQWYNEAMKGALETMNFVDTQTADVGDGLVARRLAYRQGWASGVNYWTEVLREIIPILERGEVPKIMRAQEGVNDVGR